MKFETLFCILCMIPAVMYFFTYEVNWQWKGFAKIKKLFNKKGWK